MPGASGFRKAADNRFICIGKFYFEPVLAAVVFPVHTIGPLGYHSFQLHSPEPFKKSNTFLRNVVTVLHQLCYGQGLFQQFFALQKGQHFGTVPVQP
ncbi:hypothetical protein D3C72_1567250 [compost metagenome]